MDVLIRQKKPIQNMRNDYEIATIKHFKSLKVENKL